ncbi:DNA polymerase IV [Comamonas sp. JUb58]|uniref:Y-family DNA polymerase n=1 Tax=Comamonas sp. JUb58 TaxID=2485114 RepID=UPI00105FF779|nr:DNA polymerase IV [Comamonas sp. JUb58]TDS85306.1 DNA polymerase-4 [Comamonas sp. JUb58]
MDAFYASAELLRYPQLKGLPVIIGGGRRVEDEALKARYGDRLDAIPPEAFPQLKDYVGRGVITTATYPARAFGVGSAMGMMKAAKLCPQAILLPVDFARYRHFSRQFKAIITAMAPQMEDRGVDEVYIDFTHVEGGQDDHGRSLALRMQAVIHAATGLTCSVGVAPNKQLAKMASEFNKPNGVSIVLESDLQTMIWPLACRKINGVGPKADAKLQALGITTLGDLAAKDLPWLVEHFGRSYGAWLHASSWGRDNRPVVTESEPVSMSRETTFDRDLHAVRDKAELGAIFTELCQMVAADLQRKGYVGRTIGIKLRYPDFRIATRDHSLPLYTQDAAAIRHAAGQCLKRAPLDQRLRLLGVRVGGLLPLEQALAQGLVGDWQAMRQAQNRLGVAEQKADPYTLPLFDDLD